MAHVHDQADPVHLLDHLLAHAGQPHVLSLVTTGRQQRLVVIGELHETGAERVQDLDQPDVVLYRRGVLKAKEHRGAPGFAGLVDVAGPLPLHDQIRVLLEPAVPLFEVQNRLAEGLVIGNGDMDRVHVALAQLAKDFFRPVGILQAVDTVSGHSIPPITRDGRSHRRTRR